MNNYGYVCKGRPKHNRAKSNIFIVKHQSKSSTQGRVELPNISFPKEFNGKRIRFKVEIVPDTKPEDK